MVKNTAIKFTAYQVAENINIKKFKADFAAHLLYSSNHELFYRIDEDSYAYVLNYGVVIFANYDDVRISHFLDLIKKDSENILEARYREDYILYENPEKEITFSHNSLSVPKTSDDIIRITMLYVGQSVALDYYTDISQVLVNDMSKLTQDLEKHGKLKISKSNLLKFIGKTLNVNNSIVDNLYILDSPEVTWENEILHKVSAGLVSTFDLKLRFREVEYSLKMIENNLNIFTGLLHNKESTTLEMIVVALILFEVLNVIFEKLL